MSDFIRARSPEQKEQRIAEIKEAADSLFRTRQDADTPPRPWPTCGSGY